MWTDMDSIIAKTDEELENPETSKERVQELFQEWWERRIGWAVLEGNTKMSDGYSPLRALNESEPSARLCRTSDSCISPRTNSGVRPTAY